MGCTMQFDLRKFLYSGQKPYHADLTVDLSQGDFPGYQVNQPVKAVFDASTDGTVLEMQLSVSAVVEGECARCLEPAFEELDFTREWAVRMRDLDDPDFELPLNENQCVELEELVYQELLLEAPMILLCDPDCFGLCPICGKKKVAGCTCQSAEDAAPANGLSILKALLQ